MSPRLVRLRSFPDERGTLTVADGGDELPFAARRYFLVHGVPGGASRADHAQRTGHELLSCAAGGCTVKLLWRNGEATHRLVDPGMALYVPPRVWARCSDFSPDAALLVLCSHAYDPSDQITDFAEFSELVLGRAAEPRR
jgi:hypothetical protein